jgi:MFS family permease
MDKSGSARTPPRKSRRQISRQSFFALDWLNFFKADTQTTIGAYLAIFLLVVRRWDPAKIGIAISVPAIAAIIAQTPMGALVDWSARKRALVVVSALGLGVGAVLLVSADSLAIVTFAQTTIAVASTIIPPAIASISLGLVGRRWFAQRMGRNEAYSHGGALAAAIAAAAIAFVSQAAIFYFAAGLSIAIVFMTLLIRPNDIDPLLAREGTSNDKGGVISAALRDLTSNRRVMIFLASVSLFHLGSAAMLPLVGEMISAVRATTAQPYMSACIVTSQLVMLPTAVVAGRLTDVWGRKSTLLIGFGVLPIRGLLLTVVRNPSALVITEILDGVSTGIFGVVAVVIVADLARNTGRFNLTQGAMNTCVAIGGSLSNLIAGFVAKSVGFGTTFLLLTALAVVALLFFWTLMPETQRHFGRRRPWMCPWPQQVGIRTRHAVRGLVSSSGITGKS